MKLTKYLKWSKNTNFNKIIYPHCGNTTSTPQRSSDATSLLNKAAKLKKFYSTIAIIYLQSINHSISRCLTPFIKN